MSSKPRVFFTSNVFTPDEIGSNERIKPVIRQKIAEQWKELSQIADVDVFDGRFPTQAQLTEIISEFNPDIVGCHLSHPFSAELLETSHIFAISTSTAGYNHIERTERDDILITHTPGVLHETVADYTIAIIMANLRNLIDLHDYVWEGKWLPEDKWDLDQDLSSTIDSKVIGIVGLGEIGAELLKRLHPWGVKILYYDIQRRKDLESQYKNIIFRDKLEEIFTESDIVSLHIPLNKHTEKIINRRLLKSMRKNALLVNAARGGILNMEDLLELLENREIEINISFDVFPEEPIDLETLRRLKKIKKEQPDLRMILIPHNASADADTRGRMNILFLSDIIKLVNSKKIEDLKDINIIPEHKSVLNEKNWRINSYWENKN